MCVYAIVSVSCVHECVLVHVFVRVNSHFVFVQVSTVYCMLCLHVSACGVYRHEGVCMHIYAYWQVQLSVCFCACVHKYMLQDLIGVHEMHG